MTTQYSQAPLTLTPTMIDTTTYQSPLDRSTTRSGGIDMIVLHSTETRSLAETAQCFMSEKERNVSVHYVVDRDGKIYQFVPEDRSAFHAGKSHWRLVDGSEVSNINSRSIGIEFQRGPGETFTPAQIQAGLLLTQDIKERHNIDPHNVVFHSDIAPERKSDPGMDFPAELFSYNGLMANGERRGNDGRSININEPMLAAARNGAFDLKKIKNMASLQQGYVMQQESMRANNNNQFGASTTLANSQETTPGLTALLGVGLSLLSGSSLAGNLLTSLASNGQTTSTDSALNIFNNKTLG